MKHIFTLLMQKDNRKMGLSFVLFLFFIVFSLASLVRGIADHETVRTLIALAGLISCIALCYLNVYTVIKNSKKVVPAKPSKRRSAK